jgi:hypothetical protein
LRIDTTSVKLLPFAQEAKHRSQRQGSISGRKWLAEVDTAFYRVIRTSRELQGERMIRHLTTYASASARRAVDGCRSGWEQRA